MFAPLFFIILIVPRGTLTKFRSIMQTLEQAQKRIKDLENQLAASENNLKRAIDALEKLNENHTALKNDFKTVSADIKSLVEEIGEDPTNFVMSLLSNKQKQAELKEKFADGLGATVEKYFPKAKEKHTPKQQINKTLTDKK